MPTGGWTVVMAVPRADIVNRIRGALLTSAGLGLAGLLGLLAGLLAGLLTRRIGTAVAAARRVALSDLTGEIDAGGSDETGQLLQDVAAMTTSLREIVSQVKHAGTELDRTARQLATASGRELLGTMEGVAGTVARFRVEAEAT